MGAQLAVRSERENTYKYTQTHPQDPAPAPELEEVAERTAYSNANGEYWAERSSVDKERSGIRRSRMRLRRTASDRESHPTEMPKLSRCATEGIWHKGTTGLEGNPERAKTSLQSNTGYGTAASPWVISELR